MPYRLATSQSEGAPDPRTHRGLYHSFSVLAILFLRILAPESHIFGKIPKTSRAGASPALLGRIEYCCQAGFAGQHSRCRYCRGGSISFHPSVCFADSSPQGELSLSAIVTGLTTQLPPTPVCGLVPPMHYGMIATGNHTGCEPLRTHRPHKCGGRDGVGCGTR